MCQTKLVLALILVSIVKQIDKVVGLQITISRSLSCIIVITYTLICHNDYTSDTCNVKFSNFYNSFIREDQAPLTFCKTVPRHNQWTFERDIMHVFTLCTSTQIVTYTYYVCAHVCIYLHVYRSAYHIHTHTHTYTHTYTHITPHHTHTYAHTHTHTHTQTNIHTHRQTYTCVHNVHTVHATALAIQIIWKRKLWQMSYKR